MLRSLIEKKGKFDFRRRIHPPRIENQADFDKMVDLGVIDCLDPAKPFISKETPVVAAGSCFALNITRELSDSGYDVHVFNVSDRLFTPPALRAFVLKGLRDGEPATALHADWPGVVQENLDEGRRKLQNGAIFIITFGLSVIWKNLETGEVVYDPTEKLPMGALREPDLSKFKMIQMPVPEITECLMDIVDGLRAINPDIKIVMTLSPVSLAYSGMDYPVVVADCISKSSLRVALDEFLQLRLKDVYYFPSFELLRWLGPMVDTVFGADDTITHVRRNWIAYTMAKFRQYYCLEAAAPPVPPPLTAPPF